MSSAGKGSANNPDVITDATTVPYVLGEFASKADYLRVAADEADVVVANLQRKADKLGRWLADAEDALARAQKTATAARRAADKANG